MADAAADRRRFLRQGLAAGALLLGRLPPLEHRPARPRQDPAKPSGAARDLRLGLVTYLWGRDLPLPALLEACEKGGLLGVELRTTHAHGVEPSLDAKARREVRARFADSPVELVGLGSDERFDHPDPERLEQAIQATQTFLQLSHDVGGSGVKVKPDSFHPGVSHDRTIEQIGRALNRLGAFAGDLGQDIRLEAHGQCAPAPILARILAIADHPRVGLCWNCNDEDLQGEGLAANFRLLRPRFGRTMHVRAFDQHDYPYPELFGLVVETGYRGWALLEARGSLPEDRAAAFARERRLFEELVAAAREHQAGS